MRHAVYGRILSRDTKGRKSLLNNLASALFAHGQIMTTLAKAKFAKPYVEKMVSNAKGEKLYLNRKLASNLEGRAFSKLVNEIGPGFEKRQGGYTRIVRLNKRKGDDAQMARLELLEWDKTKVKVSKASKVSKVTKGSRQRPTSQRGSPLAAKVTKTKKDKK